MFITTKDTYGERKKAANKNHNYPILVHMYHGPDATDLECLMSGAPSFHKYICLVRGIEIQQFQIEFNHIRQQLSDKVTHPGHSLDKGYQSPSELFRTYRLDDFDRSGRLIEFMMMMPVSKTEHKQISVASCYADITLKTFNKANWPWILQNATNFNSFCKAYNLELSYRKFIKHMSNI
jgi:hypothetical protein